MPKRIIRPYLDSESVNRLTPEAEVVYIRLMQIADDYGIFPARIGPLCSALFPDREHRDVSPANMRTWLGELVSVNLVRIDDHDGKEVGQIIRFGQRIQGRAPKLNVPQSWLDDAAQWYARYKWRDGAPSGANESSEQRCLTVNNGAQRGLTSGGGGGGGGGGEGERGSTTRRKASRPPVASHPKHGEDAEARRRLRAILPWRMPPDEADTWLAMAREVKGATDADIMRAIGLLAERIGDNPKMRVTAQDLIERTAKAVEWRGKGV